MPKINRKNNSQNRGRKLFNWLKRKYPGCILFFRMDDDYECFFGDVKICSDVLGLIPTIRNRINNRFSFLTIPTISIERSVQKMIAANYKVAVFEKVEVPMNTINLTVPFGRRHIVRVINPYVPTRN